ncbi:5'-3' exonuclease [Rhodovibrio sodomensis]|uniref:5'-3' exonuclease n=1 Tax=Rhodovibrio sodomensis TaxID=1088 RepID=UPI001904BCF1|nr:5'-3' exonuclease H3TH domain-containing protein [Rhodovibrio sodomensis]
MVLVDGSGYLWRAFSVVPPRHLADGTPVNAVTGFIQHLLVPIVRRARASHIAVVFDPEGETFRHAIYPAYKANRSEKPADLVAQQPLIRQASEAFGVSWVEAPGYEADDVIATYARQAVEAGLKVTIVSSDKDLMQLVGPEVSIYHPQTKRVIRAAEVEAKLGVGPEKVVDLQALAGDPTDGVPGVRGIGVKGAAKLIRQFGDLDAILANLETLPPSALRARLQDGVEAARISRDLVRLEADAVVPVELESLRARPAAPGAVAAFLNRVEMQVRGLSD